MQKNIRLSPFTLLQIRQQTTARKLVFGVCAAMCFTPLLGPVTALITGIIIVQVVGHPYQHLNHKVVQLLLKLSVVGLGFGMNLHSTLQAGKAGLLLSGASVIFTLFSGYLLGRVLKVDFKTAYLIACGTAICGGSAIAATSPVIKARENQISVALGCIFILNAVALLIFPVVGHLLNLSQTQFGLWCAIAIHDTSSVVGAAGKFGAHALEIATTVKLTRALWIIPVSIFSAFLFKSQAKNIKVPYFIGLFILALTANTYLPFVHQISLPVVALAKALLTLTLFLIGTSLSKKVLMSVGVKPLLQGITLWIAISGLALLIIVHWF